MTLNLLRDVLLWAGIINYGILIFWALLYLFMHEALYYVTTRLFRLSVEHFDMLQYGGMLLYKLAIILLFLVPALALWIIG